MNIQRNRFFLYERLLDIRQNWNTTVTYVMGWACSDLFMRSSLVQMCITIYTRPMQMLSALQTIHPITPLECNPSFIIER